MIKLERPPAPGFLTPAFVAAETARFKSDGSAVWDIPALKDALAQLSEGKCAYCEIRLGEGAVYLEVEHFFAKSVHGDRVLQWDNLLPCCRRCNGRKGNFDVDQPGQMLVDPCTDDPVAHIRLDEAYRPIGRTTVGQLTILEIALDDINRLGVARYRIGEAFKRKLEELHNDYLGMAASAPLMTRRGLIRRVKNALRKGGRDEQFSAVFATVAMRSHSYATLKDAMILNGDWDADLIQMDSCMATRSLGNP